MKLRRERAELAHVAEHRDAHAGDIERGERGKRRAHGIGVRIVGVVDDGEAARSLDDLLASRLGLGARKRRCNLRGLHAGGESDGGGGAGVGHVVHAAQLKGAFHAHGLGHTVEPAGAQRKTRAARRIETHILGPHGRTRRVGGGKGRTTLGGLSGAIIEHARDATGAQVGELEQLRGHIVRGVDERHAACGQRLEQLGFGARDVLAAAQKLDVAFADIGDKAPLRAHEPAQLLELMKAAHAHLDDDVSRVGLSGQHGVGDAELVVLVALCGAHAAGCGEHVAHEVLRGGLARGPGDADDAALEAIAPCARKRRDGGLGIGDLDNGGPGGCDFVVRSLVERVLREHAYRARRHGGGGEGMPVHPLTGQRNVERPRFDVAGIPGQAGDLRLIVYRVDGKGAARGTGGFVDGETHWLLTSSFAECTFKLLAGDDAVVEGEHFLAYQLIVLMALAGNQD